jgi:hypothetical protein
LQLDEEYGPSQIKDWVRAVVERAQNSAVPSMVAPSEGLIKLTENYLLAKEAKEAEWRSFLAGAKGPEAASAISAARSLLDQGGPANPDEEPEGDL